MPRRNGRRRKSPPYTPPPDERPDSPAALAIELVRRRLADPHILDSAHRPAANGRLALRHHDGCPRPESARRGTNSVGQAAEECPSCGASETYARPPEPIDTTVIRQRHGIALARVHDGMLTIENQKEEDQRS